MTRIASNRRPAMRVLLAEDDARTADFIAEGLGRMGYDIALATDGEQACAAIDGSAFDLLVLDRMLPGRDGMAVLAHVRARRPGLPVLMLTALGGLDDRVQGLAAGADDYLVKPFALAELDARMQALGRRGPHADAGDAAGLLGRGRLVIDLIARVARYDGVPVDLHDRELRLLEHLVREEGRTLTRAMLLKRVWKLSFDPRTNIIETHVSRLRSKLADAGARNMIETVRGVGYRLRA